MKCDHLLNT